MLLDIICFLAGSVLGEGSKEVAHAVNKSRAYNGNCAQAVVSLASTTLKSKPKSTQETLQALSDSVFAPSFLTCSLFQTSSSPGRHMHHASPRLRLSSSCFCHPEYLSLQQFILWVSFWGRGVLAITRSSRH